jgi:DNA polymerase III alpha subunit
MGLLVSAIERRNSQKLNLLLKDFKKTFGEDFYVEVQSHNPTEINAKTTRT